MKTIYNDRSIYEAPEVEELVLHLEECILDSLVQNGGGEKILDESEAGF